MGKHSKPMIPLSLDEALEESVVWVCNRNGYTCPARIDAQDPEGRRYSIDRFGIRKHPILFTWQDYGSLYVAFAAKPEQSEIDAIKWRDEDD